MKTYRNGRHGFEIDIPEEWSVPMREATSTPFGEGIVFWCGPGESFNFQIGQSIPESVEQTEHHFRRYAQGRQYTDLVFGRIRVGGRDHVWARYHMGARDWTKKYLIVFGETEYDITATCFDSHRFAEREDVWDTIVMSFRLVIPEKSAAPGSMVERLPQESQLGERGYGESGSRPGKGSHQANEMRTSNKTLAFSIISYLLIAVLAFLYIQSKVDLRVLFSQISPGPQPFSGSGFDIALAVFFGMGACVCLVIALRLAIGGQGASDRFVSRTMQTSDRHKATIGEIVFSDYTKKPGTILDALRLQAQTLVRALFKILTVYLSVATLNRAMMVAVAVLVFVPDIVLNHTTPMLWNAVIYLFWFLVCYRAQLLSLAKTTGVAKAADVQEVRRAAASSSLGPSVRLASTSGMTPELIEEILGQESIIQAIKNDLMRTGQIGYKEVWRLGLIAPDQDRFDPRPSGLSLQERMRKLREDASYRATLSEQIALKRTAVLYNPTAVGSQPNRLTVAGGVVKPLIGFYPGWSYGLSTVTRHGEFVRIRDLLIDTNSPSSRNRSRFLPQFLREDGFPIKASYADGDPLSTDRGGTVVLDKGKPIIIYPRYFVQRRLIDDQGDLIDLGLDEDLSQNPVFAVKMRPSVSEGLVRSVKANDYVPVVRYRSVPYASDFMFPIVDTPMSDSGWADLYIDTRGKGKLFIAKEKSLDEWYEMMGRLRELLYSELARKDYHLLGLAQDRAHLNEYLAKKQVILADYYIIRDWALP